MEAPKTLQECLQLRNRGVEPLLTPLFSLPIELRKELQEFTFGNPRRGNTAAVNSKFYKWVWDNKPHFCEECGAYLPFYSAAFVSHIQSRGAHPETAHDPRNTNIVCKPDHDKWETGKRTVMKIYRKNVKTLAVLAVEYRPSYLK